MKRGDVDLDGLINFYKPPGVSSARALDRVRAVTSARKSGHAGTLDPTAEGVLLICLGKGTKLVEALMDQPKVYRAVARLDVTNAVFDAEKPFVPVPVAAPPDAARVHEVCRTFEGEIPQVPPAASAVKIDGTPAYKFQRAGRPVELGPRPVRIYWLHVHQYEWPVLDFEVACGRGTYIRALIRDLGQALGAGGCLTALQRTAIGPFRAADAWPLGRLAEAAAPEYLVPLETARALLAVPDIPPRPQNQQSPKR